jgi:hypothetical protein
MTVVEALGWRDIIAEMEHEDQETVAAILNAIRKRR